MKQNEDLGVRKGVTGRRSLGAGLPDDQKFLAKRMLLRREGREFLMKKRIPSLSGSAPIACSPESLERQSEAISVPESQRHPSASARQRREIRAEAHSAQAEIPEHNAGLHAFRHGLATELPLREPITVLQTQMRHADVRTTLRVYATLFLILSGNPWSESPVAPLETYRWKARKPL